MEVSSLKSSKENNYLKRTVGATAGFVAYGVTRANIMKPYYAYFDNSIKKFTKNENVVYRDTQNIVSNKFKDIFTVKVEHIDVINAQSKIDELKTLYDKKIANIKNPLKKFKFKQRKKKAITSIERISKGENACYKPFFKTVCINNDMFSFAGFHEFGHAINHQKYGFDKIIMPMRNINKKVLLAFFIFALLSKKDDKNNPKQEEKNLFNKMGNTIERNIFSLTLALYSPMLLDEAMASINANKITKGLLSETLRKKMNKSNIKAFGSYFFGTLAAAACMKIGFFIKNKIVTQRQPILYSEKHK